MSEIDAARLTGPDAERIFIGALNAWGEGAQIGMTVEECAEFIVEASHYGRQRVSRLVVAEEVADVLIAMHQMRRVFGAQEVDAAVGRKMRRLDERQFNARTRGGRDAR